MDIQTERGLKEAFDFLEAGNPEEASKIVQNSFLYDSVSPELIFTSNCCNRWIDYIRNVMFQENPMERGESLLAEWKNFLCYVKAQNFVYQPTVYAICRGVFSLALQNFNRLLNEKDPVIKADVLRKTGLCYKKLGEFENAKMCLAQANSLHQGQAAVLADLADCYALCGEDKYSKVLFREAFFIDSKKIDLEYLDSPLINRLAEKTEEQGYSGALLNAWIPVYGVLWGVFSIRRNLKPQEVARLRQEIYAMENEHKDPSRDSEILVPRLINKYFWLIDYCQTVNDTRLINEILLKIKILDTEIYRMYVK